MLLQKQWATDVLKRKHKTQISCLQVFEKFPSILLFYLQIPLFWLASWNAYVDYFFQTCKLRISLFLLSSWDGKEYKSYR